MKIPSRYFRMLVQSLCLMALISCQSSKPLVDPVSATNHGKPDPVSGSDMKSMETVKEKM